MRYSFFCISVIGLLGLFCAGSPAPAYAAADGSRVVQLHLDDGFVGRAVRMPLFDGAVRLEWGPKDLVANTELTVELLTPTSVHLMTSSGWSGGGLSVGLRAISVSSTWTDVALGVQTASGTSALPSKSREGYVFSSVTSSDVLLTEMIVPHGMRIGTASWYRYKKCRCAASPDFPKGTRILVQRLDDPSRATVIRVNDFGPERDKFPDRVIDLDYVAFSEIGNPRGGVLEVKIEPLAPGDPRVVLADAPLPKEKTPPKKPATKTKRP